MKILKNGLSLILCSISDKRKKFYNIDSRCAMSSFITVINSFQPILTDQLHRSCKPTTTFSNLSTMDHRHLDMGQFPGQDRVQNHRLVKNVLAQTAKSWKHRWQRQQPCRIDRQRGKGSRKKTWMPPHWPGVNVKLVSFSQTLLGSIL